MIVLISSSPRHLSPASALADTVSQERDSHVASNEPRDIPHSKHDVDDDDDDDVDDDDDDDDDGDDDSDDLEIETRLPLYLI
ncbi:hypothetical protein PoB_006223900 [Plakobranchus ocellatus]|uniref:Uncharacterized protein n=1 Tax=Plakobranchus ocellatus TaxID=259542 RepID=A0AAV4CV04_9GAST|nr:hypothetical protein PoB_006223900 [Plakobranchus ocellatus]